jgi:hypothetical protein
MKKEDKNERLIKIDYTMKCDEILKLVLFLQVKRCYSKDCKNAKHLCFITLKFNNSLKLDRGVILKQS